MVDGIHAVSLTFCYYFFSANCLPATGSSSFNDDLIFIKNNSNNGLVAYFAIGKYKLIGKSEIISCHCATQPTVRAIANMTVNIERGMPMAL